MRGEIGASLQMHGTPCTSKRVTASRQEPHWFPRWGGGLPKGKADTLAYLVVVVAGELQECPSALHHVILDGLVRVLNHVVHLSPYAKV